jgi:hypothetical protein
LIPERITVKFNFADELEWGETLTLALSELDVVSGTDSDPNFMLRLQPVISVSGDEVSQQLRLGTAGVLYRLTIEATTNTGRTLVKEANLVVFPSEAIAPLPFGDLYTTTLYPLETMEGFDSTSFGLVQGGVVSVTIESVGSQFSLLSGILSGGINTYTNGLPEGINAGGFTPLSGIITSIIVSYINGVPEGIDAGGFTPLSGTLVVIVISYLNYPPEGIDAATFLPLSGTLV